MTNSVQPRCYVSVVNRDCQSTDAVKVSLTTQTRTRTGALWEMKCEEGHVLEVRNRIGRGEGRERAVPVPLWKFHSTVRAKSRGNWFTRRRIQRGHIAMRESTPMRYSNENLS